MSKKSSMFEFDCNVIAALQAAIAVSRKQEVEVTPFELFFFLLLADDIGYAAQIFEMAGVDHAALVQAVESDMARKYPALDDVTGLLCSGQIDDMLDRDDIPYHEARYDPLITIVLTQAAIHAYSCGRGEKAFADLHDVLVSTLTNVELDRPDYYLLLGKYGLTSLALKQIDAEIHAPDGLIDSLNIEAVPFIEAQFTDFGEAGALDWSGIASKDGESDDIKKFLVEGLMGIEDSSLADILRGIVLQDNADDSQKQTIFKVPSQFSDPNYLKQVFGGHPEFAELTGETPRSADLGERSDKDEDPAGVEASLAEDEKESADGQSRKMTAEERRLLAFTVDLTKLAEDGKLDELVGREKELERIFEILCCRRKNKPLVIGESGTGKTALIEGLALKIARNEVPPFLRGTRIYKLNAGTLVSRYRGAFASQLEQIVKHLKKLPDATLFIDDIHLLVDGNGEGGAEQINALQRMVSENIRIIASTSFKPWRSVLSRHTGIARRFQPVELEPVSADDAVRILKGIAPQYERYHGVHFAEGVIERVVTLSERYIVDSPLPEKAVGVLDELAASARMNREGTETITVGEEGVSRIISRIARVPAEQIDHDESSSLRTLDATLKEKVFGQDEAIDSLVSAIRVSRSGLGSAERPVGSFLFTGPTGVGKTEVARQLAGALGIPLLRFDMSEYSEKHTVSRLIGSPAGYVGHEEGGLLTESVTKNPHSVVLLDELEKAHPTLFNLLLQVMDNGRLTDAAGRVADFHNVILIMTSNVGARLLERQSIGFGEAGSSDSEADQKKALKTAFTPEFRNRLDTVVNFKPLERETLMLVVGKFLGELTSQLLAKNVTPVYTDALKDMLCREGYDPHMGARPMRRLIADKIRRPLAEELLFGKLVNGGSVTIDAADGEIRIETH